MHTRKIIVSLLGLLFCFSVKISAQSSVCIIGAGAAGLASAYLLDQDYDVLVLEKRDRIGGHAHTIHVPLDNETVQVEIGCEFFNERMFPTFLRLLKILELPTQPFALGYTFFSTRKTAEQYVLPPLRNEKILWSEFSASKIFTLVQFKYMLDKGRAIVDAQDMVTTLEEFTDSLWLTCSFKNDFFFPLFSAGWGVSPAEFKKFSAYNILSWLIKNKPLGLQKSMWVEIIGGVERYIKTICSKITRGTVKTAVDITNIDYNGVQYTITDAQNNVYSADHLIVATNAYEASMLLQHTAQAASVCDILNKFDYFKATLAIHGDARYMPKDKEDWSVANVWYNGIYSSLTTYKSWKTNGSGIFRSWLFPGFPKPEPLYALEYFYHGKQTAGYFEAQKELALIQGNNNLWFAGLYTHDIDSHENAILSAVKIAQKLAPCAIRLQALEIAQECL